MSDTAPKRTASFAEPQGKRTRGAKAKAKTIAQPQVQANAGADGVVVPPDDIVLLIRAHAATFMRTYIVPRTSVSDDEWKFALSAKQFGRNEGEDDDDDAAATDSSAAAAKATNKSRYFADDYATFKRLVRLTRLAQNIDEATIKNAESRLPHSYAHPLAGLYVAHEIVLFEGDEE